LVIFNVNIPCKHLNLVIGRANLILLTHIDIS
jgi:hypothetical protein